MLASSLSAGAWRSFALLALYNLAFIVPLVAVFIVAAKTTDAFGEDKGQN